MLKEVSYIRKSLVLMAVSVVLVAVFVSVALVEARPRWRRWIPPRARIASWDVGLTATLDYKIPYSDVSVFGVASAATDGFDMAYDQIDPPAPPAGVATYFWYPDNTPPPPIDFRKLSTSRISPYPPMTWTYRVYTVDAEGTIQVSWSQEQIANIPQNYDVLFLGDEVEVNMRDATEHCFSAEAGATYEFTVYVGN